MKLKKTIKEIFQVIRQPEMKILPGNLAFYLVMSIIPIVSLLGFFMSLFSLSTDTIIDLASEIVSENVLSVLMPFIGGGGLTAGNIMLIFIGFYLSSNGAASLIIAANHVYKIDNRTFLLRRIKALIMMVWLLILFIFLLIVLAFGNLIMNWLSQLGMIGEFLTNFGFLWLVIRILLSFFFVFVLIKILYTMAPDTRIKSKQVNRGSTFATLGLLLATSAYSFYVNNFARYDVFYGNLANIIILILLIYIISYTIVLGIAINQNYYMEKKASIENK